MTKIKQEKKWINFTGLTLAIILSLLYFIFSPVIIFFMGFGPLIVCALESSVQECLILSSGYLAPFIAIASILTFFFSALIATLFARTTKMSRNPLSLQLVSIIIITAIIFILPIIDVLLYVKLHIGTLNFTLSLGYSISSYIFP